MRGRVDLSVAFYDDEDREPFRGRYAVLPDGPDRKNLTGKVLSRLTDALESDADVARLVASSTTVRRT